MEKFLSSSKSNRFVSVLKLLKQVSTLSSSHLPISHSLIPYDILTSVIYAKATNQKLSVKSLFASLTHSDMGIRHHFDRLVNNGWIELVEDVKDKRIKLCLPTDKCEERFAAIANDLITEIELNIKVKNYF